MADESGGKGAEHGHGEGPTWKKSAVRDYFEAICIAVIFALFVRTFVVQAFKIPSSSMEDNLLVGDHILVNKFAYGPRPTWLEKILPYRRVGHEDVVVFKYPKDARRDFIKRVIGKPGDRLTIREGQVYRNGSAIDQSYVTIKSPPGMTDHPELWHRRERQGPWRVNDGELFVMGDNRMNSEDSRFWGMVPRSYLKGRALLIYWSFDVPDHLKAVEVDGDSSPVDKGRSLGYTMLHFLTRTRWSRTFKLID